MALDPTYAQLVDKALKAKFGGMPKCPLCGGVAWSLDDIAYIPQVGFPIPTPLPAIARGAIPTIPLTCTSCLSMIFFPVRFIGITQPPASP